MIDNNATRSYLESAEYKTWEKYQKCKNYRAMVKEESIFFVTYLMAARSIFCPDGNEAALKALKGRLFKGQPEEMLHLKLLHNFFNRDFSFCRRESVFFVSLKGGVAGNLGAIETADPFPHEMQVFLVLPKIGELLGADVSCNTIERSVPSTYVFGVIPFGFQDETVKKVTFVWSRALSLVPLIPMKNQPPQGESWDDFLKSLQEKGELCDEALSAGDETVKIHRVALLKKGCGHLGGVKLEVTEETLNDFVDFLYMSEQDFIDWIRYQERDSHIVPLYKMGEKYNIPQLMNCCVHLLNLFAEDWGLERFRTEVAGIDNSSVKEILTYLEEGQN